MFSALFSFPLCPCLQLSETLLLYCLYYFVDCFLTPCKHWQTSLFSSVSSFCNRTDLYCFPVIHAFSHLVCPCHFSVMINSVRSKMDFCVDHILSRSRNPPHLCHIILSFVKGSMFVFQLICLLGSLWRLFHRLIHRCR